jgi:hypothetical protein
MEVRVTERRIEMWPVFGQHMLGPTVLGPVGREDLPTDADPHASATYRRGTAGEECEARCADPQVSSRPEPLRSGA